MSTPDIPTDATANASSAMPTTMVSHTGYERTDIKIYAVLAFLVVVGISLAVLEFGLWELLALFRSDAATHRVPQTPLATKTAPPEPRLQQQPLIDYARFSERQSAQLESYGWIDRSRNVVRVPISTAIDRIVKQGLPKFAPPQTPPTEKPDPTGKATPARK